MTKGLPLWNEPGLQSPLPYRARAGNCQIAHRGTLKADRYHRKNEPGQKQTSLLDTAPMGSPRAHELYI